MLTEVPIPLWRRLSNPYRRYFRTLAEIARREEFIAAELEELAANYKEPRFLDILRRYRAI